MVKDKNILVSIIAPAYNCSSYISNTLHSVLRQTYQHWEILVVDDCSTDDTVACVQHFVEKDNRIKLIQLSENSGAAVARNKGIEYAQGQYIAFLDSDDLWLPNKLEEQIHFMEQNNVALSYTAYHLIDESGEQMGAFIPPEKLNYHDLLKTCSIGCLTAMYDVKKIGKVYMPLIRKRQDYGLWLKILKEIPEAQGMIKPLAQYRLRADSISSNKFAAAQYQWKIYRQVEGLSLFESCYYFCHYTVNGFRKYK